MRMIHVQDQNTEQAFARRAARCFAKDAQKRTYAEGEPTSGEFLALRWGTDNDCVLVVRLDEFYEPVNYQQLVTHYNAKAVDRAIAAVDDIVSDGGDDVTEHPEHEHSPNGFPGHAEDNGEDDG